VAGKEKDLKERDWDREMREWTNSSPSCPTPIRRLAGRVAGGVPTVPRISQPHAVHARPGRCRRAAHDVDPGRTWASTGDRNAGVAVQPRVRPQLIFYTLGAVTVVVAGAWTGLSTWKRRMGLAHSLSLGLVIWVSRSRRASCCRASVTPTIRQFGFARQ